MKQFFGFVLIALALFAFTSKSATFEGVIVYSVKVESKDPLLGTAPFQKLTGTELKIYVKGASMRAVCDGTSGSSGVVTTSGTKSTTSLTLGKDAAAIFIKEKILFAVKSEKTETILNKSCSLLSCDVTSDHVDSYIKKDYYLCESLKMENAPFKGNVSTLSMYKALENGSLPLKMVFESHAYKVTYTATSIQEKELHDTVLNPDQN